MKRLIPVAAATLATLSSGALAQDCDPSTGAEVGVIEIVQFRLAEGVNREDFVAAAADTMSALCATGGFIGRILSEGEDGSWTDHVRWTNADAAQAAMAGAMENAALMPFIMSIDPDSMVLSYQAPVMLK